MRAISRGVILAAALAALPLAGALAAGTTMNRAPINTSNSIATQVAQGVSPPASAGEGYTVDSNGKAIPNGSIADTSAWPHHEGGGS